MGKEKGGALRNSRTLTCPAGGLDKGVRQTAAPLTKGADCFAETALVQTWVALRYAAKSLGRHVIVW